MSSPLLAPVVPAAPLVAVVADALPDGHSGAEGAGSLTERPSLGQIARRVGASLATACVVPAALFYLVLSVAGVWPAIGAALALSYAVIGWRWLTGRRACGLLFLTAGLLTLRTVVSIAATSTFLYFLQPAITDAVVGLAFLVSLLTVRPAVARLAGDFYPLDDEVSARPRLRRLFWWLTLMWGVVSVGRALTTWWLLSTLSLETFVLVKTLLVLALNLGTVVVTIALAVRVGRREGLLGTARMAA